MNKIYRLVWNKYLALWTVVSEIARGTTKKRNVSVSASAVLSPLLNANSGYTKSKLPPVMLAALITSIFYSSNSFAGYEAGGGSTYTNCTGTSTGSGTKSGNSVAIGTRACAGGNGNLAMGYQADSSNAPDNIAFGSNAKTGNVLSPTPDGTPLNGGGQIAIGKNAQTTTAGAIAIGNDAKTGGQNFSVAIGGYAEASGNSAVAFGRRTVASGFGGVAVGANASSSGSDSTAVGSNATASMQAATALGNQALASGRGSTAVGFGANAVSVGSVAVGVNSYAAGRVKNGEDWESGAFGSNSKADGAGAVALGNYSQALADETTATGNGSKATANYATALGTLAEATAEEAVSIGHQAKAQSLSDIAIGSDATTAVGTGGHNIAMGNKVTTGATGQNVAIGSDSTTANSRTANGGAVAIGRAQTATGDGAVAIGDPNVVNGDGAIALGKDNTAAGDSAGATAANGAVALGNSNQAIGQGSVALGNTSTAAAAGAIAFGDTAAAKGGQSVSIGSNTQAVQGGDIAIGAGAYAAAKVVNGVPESAAAFGLGARADGATALAVGNNAQATADYAGALGNAAEATALEASAVGNRAQATKDYSTAVGTNATASGLQSTALGNRSRATGDFAIAQGNNTEASGQFATSVGNFSKATAESAIAVGDLANASANDATAIGTRAAASGQNSNAIGIDSKATGNAAVALGAGAAASADNALATGVGARAAAASAVALGDSANAQATRGVALGSGATATNADDVALGAGSVTGAANPTANGTVGGVTYNYAGTTPSSVVSVGSSGNERQITNVAAGRVSESSTDAINGSQLYSTQQALGNLAESTANHLGGGSVVNPDGTVTAPSYDINGTTVSNVGDALSELDKGWNLQSNGANAGAIKAGDTVDIGTVNGEENLTVTKNGNTIQYGLNKDLKVDSVTAGDTVINDNGVTITNGPSITKSGINAAGNPISNVGAGVNDTDAVNKGQLDGAAAAAKTEVTEGKNITVSKTTGADGQDIYNVATADNVEFNNVKVGDVTIDGTTGKISGVAAGDVNATSTDAINGSQLAGTAKSVSDALGGGSVVNPDGTMTAPSYDINGTTVSNVGDALSELDKGWNLQSNGANAGAIKAGDTVDIGTVTGEENLTVTKNGNTIQYGLNKDIKVDSVTAGDTVINDNGVTITNGPSITKSGINAAGNPISNVGAGVNDTDAVNKGQLDGAAAAAKTEVTEGKNITVTKTTGADGQDIYNVATADNVEFNNVKVGDVTIDGTTGKISGVAAGDVNATSTDAINGSQLAGTAKSVLDALGGGSTVNPDGTVSAPSYTVNGNNVSNVGDAITELDKGWNLQSNGANAGAIKAGDTVDIGTVTGEENLTVTKNGNTIQYGLNKDLKVDSVTAGDTVINDNGVTITNGPSITKSGINAAGNPISNVGAGVNDTDAVNKGQLDDAAAAAKTEVTQGKNITVSKTTGADGQDIYNVATADNVEFNNVKVGDVTIDGTTGKISGVAAGDVNATSTDAINGSQLAGTAKSVSDALGGGSVVNPDGTVTAPSYDINGTTVSNVGDALSELDKGWNLQSNGANAGAIKAGDTVDIGTVNGEENLTVTKNGNTIQYGLNKDLKVDSVTAGDTVINDNGVTITNGPSITKSGINAAGNSISNVADGTAPGDAVNKGQLDGAAAAAKTEVTQGKNITVSKTTGADGQDIYNVATANDVDFNNVTVGDVIIDGATGKISGVADGTIAAGSTEAINGSQLHGVADSVRNSIGGNTVLNPDGTVTTSNVGNTGESNIHDAIDSVRKNAVTAKTTVTEGDNMVVTKSTNPDGSTNYEVATAKDVKFDSVTSTDAEGNETILTGKGISLKDQAGNTTVLGQDGLGFVDPMGNSVGPRIAAGGINAGNTVITGVAPGRIAADSQDAINGSQLKGVSDSVAGAIGGNTTVNPDGTIITSDIGGTGKDNINDAIGAVGKAAKEAKTTVSKADGDENVTVTSRPNSEGGTDFQVGLSKDIKVDSVTAGNTVVNDDGLTIAGGPSVTKAGINAGDNKVTGVADGTVAAGSQDAINGGQLHGVADSIKNVVGGNATVNPDGSITTSNVGGTGQNNINDAINSVRGAAAAARSTVSNKDGNISVTPTTKADGSKDYEVGLAKDIKVDSVTAANQVNVGGATGTTIAADGVRIAEGPSMTKAGIDAGSRKVTGVSEGTIAPDSKDAINGSQLHKSYENVGKALGGGAGYDPVNGWTPPNYEVAGGKHDNVGDALNALNNADQALGDRITNLGDQMQQAFYDTNQRIDDVKKLANAGVAAAMALETAPYISGKYTYAVGAAYHGGENAVGVTLRKTADNGRWSLTTGVAAASQGDPSFRIGLSGVFD